MDNNQILQDLTQIDSSYLEENKVNSLQEVTKVSLDEKTNPDIEPTQTAKNIQSTTNESKQPQEQSSNTDEETEETTRIPQKFSDFLLQKERHKQVIKIIQEGKEAQNIKKHLNILNAYLKSTNIAQINKKLSEVTQKSESNLLNQEIFESLKIQNIQFLDDRNRFQPLNDGQIIAIQLYHYCLFDLEDKGKAQNSINLNNPVIIQWIEPLIEVKIVNENFIRLQNLEHEQKFKELSGEEQLEKLSNLKIGIFDLLTSILDLFQQKNQNDPEFEAQDEVAECFVDQIVDDLKSIDNKEFYHFLNEAIYKAVDELQLLSYFDGKLEKPIENVSKDVVEKQVQNIEKDNIEKKIEKLEKDVQEQLVENIGQEGEVQSNFSENPVANSDKNSVAESLKLPLNEQEQAKVDEDIKDFLKNPDDTEDEFIDYLLKTYVKLQDIKSQVISYLQKFKEAQNISQENFNSKEILVKINDFAIKQKIIEWLKMNKKQLPSNRQCQKDYNLNQDQLEDFQKCFQQWKVISFDEQDLLPEEKEKLFKNFKEETNFQTISDQTLIEINLVKKFFVQWTQQLKQETELLEIMLHYGGGADSSVYVEFILNDNQEEILKVLLMIYKKSKKDYKKVTDILRKYTQKFENCELEKFIRLAREKDLEQNSQKQKQVKDLLEYFLKNDIIIYLMILHELWIEEDQQQESNYLEEIILQEKHQKMIPAVAQLLILDKYEQLKAEVSEKRVFIDIKNEQFQVEKQLEEQLEASIKLDEIKKKLDSHEQIDQRQESDNIKLVDTIKRLANITNKKIKIHLMSELKHCMVYSPEKEMNQSTLLLVRDELNQVFHVMIQYENQKKQIDFRQLQDLKKKLPFLSNDFPIWLDTFVQLPSLRKVLLAEQDLQTPVEDKIVIKLLETISQTQKDFLQFKDTNNKKKLQKVVNQLWSLDFQLLQEWFHLQQQNEKMNDFCIYMITNSARQNSYWAFNQVSSLQEYFPMDPLKMTLKDFNRVQTRSELNQRKETIKLLKDQPKELAKFIINTIFGFILRKEDLSVIQSELQSVVKGSPISLRFLIAYLIQSSDMGLRARLSYYLCQNKAVPLIMNCQETYKEQNFNMKYNQELVFSMDQVEGVGVFSFGIGKMATYPCGKSEIANMIVTPKFENKSFDTNDINVLSNGQIDLFLEKCYQKKNGWAYMDGQGEIPNKNLLSVLPLTNIVLIHFFEQESTDKISVEQLRETLKVIKDSDSEILICLILRDCSETKEFTKNDYPEWLPMKDQIDKLISLVDLNEIDKQNKINEIEDVLLFFNTKVREIQNLNSNKSKCKFTKERFLMNFCSSDKKGKATYQRISEILKLSQDFSKEVQKLESNVFNEKGLPSLKIKDEIRTINLKLRSFSVQEEEDQESAAKREKQLLDQVEQLSIKLQELEINKLMQNFWQIVNHKDAVLIKIEISKVLSNFTQKRTSHLVKKKDLLLKENGANTSKKDEGLTYKQIQDANTKFQEQIKKIEEEIFETSLSYEYFWRSLICFITDSTKCTYWQNEMDKLNFTHAIRQQMLDGDTFELVDGRNLEMKGDIIRQILGNDIECAKCIVACVIGPQSTGKSTLMNFCFGTQFLASTGRCTQGIYFTLQRIPPELKQGKDVEYLIILDTEGLNSPERAEPEYDRKIVIFTLLCSDFLIINSRGDMSYQMKELIKICTVRYDQLKGNAKVPKILYTFVQNNDTNTANFITQISSLKSDVIECSTTQTVKKTTDELMTVHDNLVKVMGSAYIQQLIEKDDSKGLIESTYINTCAPIFGVHSSEVWLEVQNLFLQKDYQFRQIGTWLTEAQDHWTLIERHGAKLIEHANVIAMKNDTKMKEYFSKLWSEYLETKVTAKDNQKAKENSQIIFDFFLAGNDLNEEKKKFIQANNEEKTKDYDQMWSSFEKWKQEPGQKSLTQDLETKYNLELKKKMNVLKDSFKLLLENKLKEIQMMQIHNNGISDLFHKARLLSLTLKKDISVDQKDKLINEAFEKAWDQIMTELSGEEQIEKLRYTNCEYLSSTFRNVNPFMNNIKPQEYYKIVAAAKSEDFLYDQDLPKQLFNYLVAHIQGNAFINNYGYIDPKDQFKFDPQMLGLLKDPSERIFSEKEKDKYLPLQKLLKVNYKYEILSDMSYSLNNSTIFDQIKHSLNQKKNKEIKENYFDLFGFTISKTKIIQVDDKEKIVQSISTFFQELGRAGFGLKQAAQNHHKKYALTEEKFIPLCEINVEEELITNAIFNDFQKKKKWVEDLKNRIAWQKSENIFISQRIHPILKFSAVHFRNQMHPKIKFEEHLVSSQIIQKALWHNNKPELSYVFSDDDAGGKINVQKFLKDRNQSMMNNQYFQCLVNPVKYEMAESQKWTYLSKLTSMLIDWEKIVLTINEKISKEIIKVEQKSNLDLQEQKKNQIDTDFDLKNVLERNQITIEQAERIQFNQLQGIKQELDDELHRKLALFVHQTLSGVITWIACVIIWYKSQKNILTKFNEQQKKLENQKNIYKQNFKDIVLGVTTTVTIQGARQIFNDTYKIFNENCKNLIIKNIGEILEGKDVLDKFDTDRVYDEMDKSYINSAKANEYKKFISYVLEPVSAFESYVDSLSSVFVENLETKQMKLYKEQVNKNLNNLKKRLELVQNIILSNKQWAESVNLFEILKVGETVPLVYQEKKKIESELSSVYLNTLKSILQGTYKIGSQEVTLKVNQVETKFIFTTKAKDQNQKEIGSPLQELQNLQFEDDNNNEFIEIFLIRLGLNEKNFGLCSDLRVMIENLILTIDSKISEIEKLTLNDIYDMNQQVQGLKNNAIGCRILCKFCNRKCEHKPHNDNKERGTPHSCEKRGHQLRVFAGGYLETSWGVKYPSLLTCDEIQPSTHIKITNDKGTETRVWSEIHEAMNRNWITNYIKFKNDGQLNPIWSKMHDKLGDFWKILGEKYCLKNDYKYILADESPQFSQNDISNMNEKSIVIICLDDSGSMFNKQNDFSQAVNGGKEVEQYLKNNHKKLSQVHVQLWYNDCHGVTQAYKGQLNDKIPTQAWLRQPCQSDKEINGKLSGGINYGSCGQFTGALRILNQEVYNLLDKDPSYKRVYWFMFSDGGSSYPEKELEQLNKTFKANPEKWTDPTGTRSKLIPLIITNQLEVESLVKMNNKLNQISKEIWGNENFCSLRQNVKTDQIAETMIERFILN